MDDGTEEDAAAKGVEVEEEEEGGALDGAGAGDPGGGYAAGECGGEAAEAVGSG